MKICTSFLVVLAAQLSSATQSASAHPGSGILVDQQANVYFTHTGRGAGKIDAHGKLISPELKTTLEKLGEAVTGLAAGPGGTLFVACPSAILKVKLDGTVTTLVHPLVVKDCDFVSKESSSRFFHAPYLRRLDATEAGMVYAAVTGCRGVGQVIPAGQVETILKSEPPWAPTGVAIKGRDVFVLEYSNSDEPKNTGLAPRIRKLASSGKVTILAALAPNNVSRSDADSFSGSRAGDEREVSGVELCWCPPGRFTMGSPRTEPQRRSDEAQVEVTLTKGFWIGKYEVTQAQWIRVVGKLPGELTAGGGEGDDLPVYNLNYEEAEKFCRKLTDKGRTSNQLSQEWEFRLPTEAQWEYACRAGTTTATSFGDKLNSRQANVLGKPYNGAEPGPSLNRATKVGSYAANPWGLHDMHGNVVEWCRDWYHEKLPGGTDPDLSTVKGTRNGDGTYSRSRRGSAWTDEAWASRSALRQRYEPERRADHIGIRVVVVRP